METLPQHAPTEHDFANNMQCSLERTLALLELVEANLLSIFRFTIMLFAVITMADVLAGGLGFILVFVSRKEGLKIVGVQGPRAFP